MRYKPFKQRRHLDFVTEVAIQIRLALISEHCKYGKFKSTLLIGSLGSLLNQLNTFSE